VAADSRSAPAPAGPARTADPARTAEDQQAGDQRIRELLRGYGLRSTEQRLAILRLLATAEDGAHGHGDPRSHLSVTEIHDRLVGTGSHMDITTVYRTLTTLVDIGVVHATAHGPNLTTYGLATAAHHHAVCTQCGAISEIPAHELASTLAAVRDLTGFRVQDSALTIHGLCRNCQTA